MSPGRASGGLRALGGGGVGGWGGLGFGGGGGVGGLSSTKPLNPKPTLKLGTNILLLAPWSY